MKKQITIILSILMATLLIASCGKDPSIVGKWEYSREGTQEGNKMALKVYFDFKDDGTVNFEQFATNSKYPDHKIEPKSASSNWELSEDRKMLTIDKKPIEVLELTDSKLILQSSSFNDLTRDGIGKMPLNRVE